MSVMEELKLQYISQGANPEEHLRNIEAVCQAGVRWIQLRLKEVDIATYLTAALACRAICNQYGAIMIINDQVDIAKAAQADGVHLGLKDMSILKARLILGSEYIIGATANTLQDCLQHAGNGVDYIGLGPFKFTMTKKKLSPILGLDGYEQIIANLKKQDIHTPIVGIGGILISDIEGLYKTGLSGIAVSGLLTGQKDLTEMVKDIKQHGTKQVNH